MNNPLIDQRHFQKGPWKQEKLWVQRNSRGVVIGIAWILPESTDININLPAGISSIEVKNEN